MTVNFYLPTSGTEKNIHICLNDHKQKKQFNFCTPLRILPEKWDHQKQRPINIYEKKYKNLHKKLNDLKLYLAETIAHRRMQQKTYSQRILSREIKRICNASILEKPESSLLQFMKKYIAVKKDIISNSTHKRYMVFYRLLERFEGQTASRLFVETLDAEFISKFILYGKEEEYSLSTIYRTIHFVKTILNFAERKGVRTRVRELEIRREKQHKEIITLTEEEIIQIKETHVPEELQPAKDWLLISCYTGQRFSDFINFNAKQLKSINGKSCLAFTQQKTQRKMLLPLHPIIFSLLQKYNNDFPPVIDLHNYNNQIKKIAQLASINETVSARKRIGYRTKSLNVEKWQVVTSHIGRRSFVSNFYGKIPTPLLMEATGHTTEKVFKLYVNSHNKIRMTVLANYFEKETLKIKIV